MQYLKDFDIKDFNFWGGAQTRYMNMGSSEEEAFTKWIEECFYDSIPTDTDINDALWFDWDEARIEYGFGD